MTWHTAIEYWVYPAKLSAYLLGGWLVWIFFSRLATLVVLDKRRELIILGRRRGTLLMLARGGILILAASAYVAFVVVSPPLARSIQDLVPAVPFELLAGGLALILAAVSLDSLRFAISPAPARWRPVWRSSVPQCLKRLSTGRASRVGVELYWYAVLSRGTLSIMSFSSGLMLYWLYQGLRDGRNPGYDIGEMFPLQLVTLSILSVVPILISTRWLQFCRRIFPMAMSIEFLSDIASQMDRATPRLGVQGANPDPLNWYRWRLAAASRSLERYAARLDRTIAKGSHPVASTLRATALYLRDYCQSKESLTTHLPHDVKSVIRSALFVTAGSARSQHYQDLAVLVDAFAVDGSATNPARRRRFDALAAIGRAGEGSENVMKVLQLLLVLLTLLALFFSGFPSPPKG